MNSKLGFIIIALLVLALGFFFLYSYNKAGEKFSTDNDKISASSKFMSLCVFPPNTTETELLCITNESCVEATSNYFRRITEKSDLVRTKVKDLLSNESQKDIVNQLNNEIPNIVLKAGISYCDKVCKFKQFRTIKDNETCISEEETYEIFIKGKTAKELIKINETWSCTLDEDCRKVYPDGDGICYYSLCEKTECNNKYDCASLYPGELRTCERRLCLLQ